MTGLTWVLNGFWNGFIRVLIRARLRANRPEWARLLVSFIGLKPNKKLINTRVTPSAVRSLNPLAFCWVQLLELTAEFGHDFGRCLYPCQSPC